MDSRRLKTRHHRFAVSGSVTVSPVRRFCRDRPISEIIVIMLRNTMPQGALYSGPLFDLYDSDKSFRNARPSGMMH
jgi:hypothetical protein